MSTDSTSSPSRKEKREARAAKAAAELEALRKKQARKSILTVVAVVAAIAVIIGGLVWFSLNRSEGDKVTAVEAGSSEHGLVIGPDDAPHKVVIYEDFLCPYCAEFENASREDLAELAAEGKVQVDYRPFVLLDQIGPYSELATSAFAVVQEEAGDEVAKKFHDLLFENQPSESGPFPEAGDLVDLAVEAGAEESAVKEGIENLDGKAWADAATAAATADGVQGTPTILLDGEQFLEGNTMEEIAANLVEQIS
ncbi:thioredoxin domain-containing protein [Nocardioides sp. KC13]|uniref:Thioredoxin domain-containing protein n=1 Tax=Nocardioides turkmenicus TaxID=2711220 RepID=A0A6M1QTJ9_9ACTN|nr:thioredoxin domain-containing protein [Nocardioides sp. KC13]NGN93135.1 thioredoxin domain-containing protein [Nocardioides sp. KC13]